MDDREKAIREAVESGAVNEAVWMADNACEGYLLSLLDEARAEAKRLRAVVDSVRESGAEEDSCLVCDYGEIKAKGHNDGCALGDLDAAEAPE